MLKASCFEGPVHILRVHSHNTQGNIITSYTENGLLQTFIESFKEERDSSPTNYFFGRVVDLPPAYVEKIRQGEWEEQMRIFRDIIKIEIAQYFLTFNSLPPHIEKCSCFPQYRAENDTYSAAHSFFPYDNECGICDGVGFLLIDRDWGSLLRAYNPTWDKKVPLAGQDLDTDIYTVHIGHRPSGANIVKLPSVDDYQHRTTMFAFTGEEKPIPDFIINWHSATLKEIKNQQDVSSKNWQEKRFADSVKFRVNIYRSLGYTDAEVEAIHPMVLKMVRKED